MYRVEQVIEPILPIIKLKMVGEPHDEQLLSHHPRAKKYNNSSEIITIKEGVLVRKYCGET